MFPSPANIFTKCKGLVWWSSFRSFWRFRHPSRGRRVSPHVSGILKCFASTGTCNYLINSIVRGWLLRVTLHSRTAISVIFETRYLKHVLRNHQVTFNLGSLSWYIEDIDNRSQNICLELYEIKLNSSICGNLDSSSFPAFAYILGFLTQRW